jgi:putative peptidoglycan lipid II flippase
VFYVQCAIAATNIVLAVAFTREVSASGTAPGLVLAYAGSYLVGAVVSYSLLRRTLGGLETPRLVRFLVRLLLAAGLAAALAWAIKLGVQQVWGTAGGAEAGKLHAVVVLAVTGLVDVAVFVGLARLMRIAEVNSIIALLTARLRR